MCGRFSQNHTWAEVYEAMNTFVQLPPLDGCPGRNLGPRQNIAPTQDVHLISTAAEAVTVQLARWWLVPSWAKELQSKYPMFNAKGETVETLASFKNAFKSRRCLIPATGYYEWTKGRDDDGKEVRLPWNIHLGGSVFCFAGIWEVNKQIGPEPVVSCSIITLPSIGDIETLHHRMPVVLKTDAFDEYLSTDTDTDRALELLQDNHGLDLKAYRVSTKVNKSSYNGEDCLDPVA